jgi:hypothetical protein
MHNFMLRVLAISSLLSAKAINQSYFLKKPSDSNCLNDESFTENICATIRSADSQPSRLFECILLRLEQTGARVDASIFA